MLFRSKDPKKIKELGRLVKNFDDNQWNAFADDIVFSANLLKFSQNIELREKLLLTGDKEFVECAPYDKIWGNGLNITDTLKTPKNEWLGTNRLGKAIMRTREFIRKNN